MLSIQNLPNILTFARIAAIPVIIALMFAASPPLIVAAFILFTLAALTDFLDGWLARKLNVVSAIGRFLDPIADKLLIACILVAFCANGNLPGLWSVTAMVVLFREVMISGLREFLGPYKIVIHVTTLAKWKTTIQLIACGLLIIAPLLPPLWMQIGHAAMAIAAFITLITGWDYLRQGLQKMKGIKLS